MSSEPGFEIAKSYFEIIFVKVFFNLLVAGLTYHYISGFRHLIMDFGHWETLEAGRNSAIGTFAVSFVLSVIFTIIIW